MQGEGSFDNFVVLFSNFSISEKILDMKGE